MSKCSFDPITPTVYSLYWPETQEIVESLWRRSEVLHNMYRNNYTKKQDTMHLPLLNGWIGWARQAGIQGMEAFPHAYPTNGASEGIHGVLSFFANRDAVIHVFDGEYEGYEKLAQSLGLSVVVHSRNYCFGEGEETKWKATKDGKEHLFFVSAPSAIDGNIWDGPETDNLNSFLRYLENFAPKVKVIVDLTYIGATIKPIFLNVDRPNVWAVIFSLSKPMGVYYHRIGGLYARESLANLWGNRWFKNLFSLRLGWELIRKRSPFDIPRRYQDLQQEIVIELKKEGKLPLFTSSSDVILLASAPLDGMTPEEQEKFQRFTRVKNPHIPRNVWPANQHLRSDRIRFCLTPTMDRMINPLKDMEVDDAEFNSACFSS